MEKNESPLAFTPRHSVPVRPSTPVNLLENPSTPEEETKYAIRLHPRLQPSDGDPKEGESSIEAHLAPKVRKANSAVDNAAKKLDEHISAIEQRQQEYIN